MVLRKFCGTAMVGEKLNMTTNKAINIRCAQPNLNLGMEIDFRSKGE